LEIYKNRKEIANISWGIASDPWFKKPPESLAVVNPNETQMRCQRRGEKD